MEGAALKHVHTLEGLVVIIVTDGDCLCFSPYSDTDQGGERKPQK